jgi:hypothetical protein
MRGEASAHDISDARARMRREGRHIVETAVEARAGFFDRPVLVVLIVSTALVSTLLGVLYVASMG